MNTPNPTIIRPAISYGVIGLIVPSKVSDAIMKAKTVKGTINEKTFLANLVLLWIMS